MTPTPPQKVGPYEIIGPLGSGGMGQVFRARDPRLNREVAVKLLGPPPVCEPTATRRLAREFEALMAESAIPWRWIGTTGGEQLVIRFGERGMVRMGLGAIDDAWRSGFEHHMA